MPSLLRQNEIEAVQSAFERFRGERGFAAEELRHLFKWALTASRDDRQLQALISGEALVDVSSDQEITISKPRRQNRSFTAA